MGWRYAPAHFALRAGRGVSIHRPRRFLCLHREEK